MNIYVKYNDGLVNINKSDISSKVYNRSLYLGVGILIGVKAKKELEDSDS